jgi:hypothetical protein
MNNTVSENIYSAIIERLRVVNKKENSINLFKGIIQTLLLMTLIFFIVTLSEGAGNFSSLVRGILLFAFLVSVFAILRWFFIVPLFKYLGIMKSFNEEILARRVGNKFPSISDKMIDILQIFKKSDKRCIYSEGLVYAAVEDLNQKVKDINFTEIIDKKENQKFFRISIPVLLALFVLLFSFSGFYSDSFYHLIHFNRNFLPPAPFTFNILPGNIEITKGDSVEVMVTISGEMQERISLFSKPESQKEFENIILNKDGSNRFKTKFNNIRDEIEYYAEAKGFESERYRIKVIDRPVIKNLRVFLTYPPYTHQEPRYLDDNSGDISSIFGTRAKFELEISKDIKEAKVVFSDSQSTDLNISGRKISGEIKINRNAGYHFSLKDDKGITNIDAIEYQMRVIPDEYPSIAIIEPGKNVDISEQMRLPFLLKIKDDYGFSKLRIAYKLVKTKYSKPQETYSFQEIPIPQQKSNDMDVEYIWNLSKQNMAPEDIVSYYIEVFDNDIVSGPKAAKSNEYFVRFPSLDEVLSKSEDIQKKAMKELDKSFEETKDLKKKVDEINQDLKKSRDNLDWQKKKKIEDLAKRYNDVQKKVDEVSKDLNEMTKMMQENKAMSQETMDKYLELQKVISEINSNEFSQAMKKLQESMQNLNPDAVKQAMQNFTFNEQNFRESIERTMNILKRIMVEQKADEVLKRMDELIKKQEELKKETNNTNPNNKNKLDELSQKQNDLSKEYNDMKKEMQDLQNRMQEFKEEMPMKDMQNLMQNMEQQDNASKMNQASTQIQQGNLQQAQKSQNQASQNMQQLRQEMEQMKKNMLDNQKQMVMNQLKKTMKELLEISKSEEDLRNQSRSSNQNSPRNRDIAQKQQSLQNDLNNVINQLYDLSQKSFAVTPAMGKAIGNAMGKMSQSISHLSQRDNYNAANSQNDAMASLNEAAMQVQSSMNQMGGKSGVGAMQSLLQRLGEMASRQQGLNQGMGMFPSPGDGKQMSQEQMQAMGRMMGEQQAIKKSLDQLREEAENYGNKEKILGDLNQVSKEMEEVIKDMKQNSVDQNTIQKQERILSRLLDAQRSMRERDFDKKRKSDPGKDYIRVSPKDINFDSLEGKTRLQQDLLKVMQEGYSKDYEELIRKYYEALQNTSLKK